MQTLKISFQGQTGHSKSHYFSGTHVTIVYSYQNTEEQPKLSFFITSSFTTTLMDVLSHFSRHPQLLIHPHKPPHNFTAFLISFETVVTTFNASLSIQDIPFFSQYFALCIKNVHTSFPFHIKTKSSRASFFVVSFIWVRKILFVLLKKLVSIAHTVS